MVNAVARLWRPALTIAWVIAVALLTLMPDWQQAARPAQMTWSCLLCGSRGSSDALLNVFLFVPLGLVIDAKRRPVFVAFFAGLTFSIVIESAQLLSPGRHSSVADLLWNSAGAAAGALLLMQGRLWLAGAPSKTFRFAVSGGLAVFFVGAGWLLSPDYTEDDYWGQWTPDLGSMPQYDGTVLTAELNGEPLWSRRLELDRPHRALFLRDWSLTGRIVIGSPPTAVSPILSIYDGHQREILLLGAHRDALVLRPRTLGRRFRFDGPDLRIPGAFATLAAGDTVAIAATFDGGVTCLRLGAVERCGLGVTPGRLWGLLLYLEGPTEGVRQIMDFMWMATLFGLLGLCARTSREALVGGGVAFVGVAIAVVVTPLLAPPSSELIACLLGLFLAQVPAMARRTGSAP